MFKNSKTSLVNMKFLSKLLLAILSLRKISNLKKLKRVSCDKLKIENKLLMEKGV